MAEAMTIGSTQKALILSAFDQPLCLSATQPIPSPTPGSATIRVLATYILPYQREIFSNKRPYTLTPPLVPGNGCIGRIHAVGPDAVSLTPGQLVFGNITVSARDSPEQCILMGVHGGTGNTTRLMAGEWRDSTFAEYARFPLENLVPMDESLLLGNFGYSIADLTYMQNLLVPFGGLAEVDLKVGESILVAPATGKFGGAAVTVALAMGARVVAAGRNQETLARMKKTFGPSGRIETVALSGDVEKDTLALKASAGGTGADVFLDFSPATAAGSTHILAAIMALKRGGRAVFMGGIEGTVEIPYWLVILKSIRIQGRFMYDREHVLRFIKMIELGLVRLGQAAGIRTLGPYGLENIEEALDVAAANSTWGSHVVLTP